MPAESHFLSSLLSLQKNTRTDHCVAKLTMSRYFSDISKAIISRVKDIEIALFKKQKLINGKTTPTFSDDFLSACLTRPLFRQQIERLLENLENDVELPDNLDALINLSSTNLSHLITLNSSIAHIQKTEKSDYRGDIRTHQIETRHNQWLENHRANGLNGFFETLPSMKKVEQPIPLAQGHLFKHNTSRKSEKSKTETSSLATSTSQHVEFTV